MNYYCEALDKVIKNEWWIYKTEELLPVLVVREERGNHGGAYDNESECDSNSDSDIESAIGGATDGVINRNSYGTINSVSNEEVEYEYTNKIEIDNYAVHTEIMFF